MPIHDWTRVDAGIFHDFHHAWIEDLKRALNGGLLPDSYYALAEQNTGTFGPDVLTLQGKGGEDSDSPSPNGGVLVAKPKIQPTAETDLEYYRRRQNHVSIRHVSGDRLIAMIEIVSRGNKSSRVHLRDFVGKTAALLEKGIHLLILDLFPPSKRDPNGIHGAIWQEIAGEGYSVLAEKPLTLASYESGSSVRAHVIHTAIGGVLQAMPLFLERDACVEVPLEGIYLSAFAAVPRRWRKVLESPG